MPEISRSLIDRLLDRLGDDPLAEELRRAALPSNADAGVTLKIDMHLVPHVQHALSVGAVTMRMCGAPPEHWNEVRGLARLCGEAVPEAFGIILHRGDVEKMFSIAALHGAQVLAWREYSWSDPRIVLRAPGRPDWPISLDGKPGDGEVEAAAEAMNAFLARFGPPLEPEEPDAGP